MTTTLETTRPEIDRDRFGRPLVVPPTGGKPVPYTRCTTFVSAIEDTYNLSKWQQRKVAEGLATRKDLVLKAAAANGDKRELDQVCEDAKEAAAASAAATTGTALHKLTEKMDRGQDIGQVDGDTMADLTAYARATAPLSVQAIEQFSVMDNLMIAGTPDRIVEYGGELFIADLKTGSIEWGVLKIAMQLAAYARSKGYDIETKQRFPIGDVNQDKAIIIHLPAGSGHAELVWVDISTKGGGGALATAYDVRRWRAKKGLTEAWDPQLLDQIKAAGSRAEIQNLWTAHAHEWTEALTEAAKARIAQLGE